MDESTPEESATEAITIISCPRCEKTFKTKSGLAKHLKTCGERDRTRCKYCNTAFTTFTGVRLHETRAHQTEESEALAQEGQAKSEAALLETMARTEAPLQKGAHVLELLSGVTGLTKHQIRHRRDKPCYKELLRLYRSQASESSTPISSARHPEPSDTVASQPTADSALPTTSKDISSLNESTPETPQPSTLIPTSKPPPTRRYDTRARRINKACLTVDQPGPSTQAYSTPNASTSRPPTENQSGNLELAPHQLMPASVASEANQKSAGLLDAYVAEAQNLAANSDQPSQLLLHIINGIPNNIDLMPAYIETTLNKLFPNAQKPTQPRLAQRAAHYGRANGIRGKRSTYYKKVQQLYGKNKKSLAQHILNDTAISQHSNAEPSLQSIRQHFTNSFGSEATPTVIEPSREAITEMPWTSITADEVANAKKGWRHSAPGPDGISTRQIIQTDNRALAVVFNLVTITNTVPVSFKSVRTTLVYKSGPKELPENWRPITVGSAIQRLHHRVLIARIRSLTRPHFNQRGFTSIDGTLANSLILDTYIKERRNNGKTMAIVLLDVSKAFDTVTHSSINNTMQRFGLDSTTQNYIMASMSEVLTTIKTSAGEVEIPIKRGVRQGDPLSPILFNMVLDELIWDLNTNRACGTINKSPLAAIAFADDIALIADDPIAMLPLIATTTSFLKSRGMKLNPAKSVSLIRDKFEGRLATRAAPLYSIDGTLIKQVNDINCQRYLGHELNATGILRPSLHNLPTWLSRLSKAPLKPAQKFSILKTIVLPKIFYILQVPSVTSRTLHDADKLTKSFAKRTLHLNVHTNDASLYARVRDGGLGLMELSKAVPYTLLRRINRLSEHFSDSTLQSCLHSNIILAAKSRLAKISSPSPPYQHHREAITTSANTKGLEQASDSVASRGWINNPPPQWSGRDYVRAVQLRTHNLPTAALPYNPPQQRMCRAGCEKAETINHVLQSCPVTHWPRIRRHDEIVNKLAKHSSRQWVTEKEPHIRHQDGTLFKPDVVVHLPDQIVIADVAVSWEAHQPLSISWQTKRGVYDNHKFREAAQTRWPNCQLKILPLIIGARGIWPLANEQLALLLNIPPSLKCSMVHSSIKWASSIHRSFMSCVWRNRNHHNARRN